MTTEAKVLTAKEHSIEEYFSSDKEFVVPRYQRNYAWEKGNITQLVDDLRAESEYYIGNIIINSVAGKRIIIDGQQRIISIFLLFMALKNKTNEVDKYICDKRGNLKINIEKRSEQQGVPVLKAIYDNSVSAQLKKFNEYQRYNDIEKYLGQLNEDEKNKLYQNLLGAVIVEISFSNREEKAHEMFVSLNTKGKPLEEIEILKSHLFKYLTEDKNSDKYKDEWFGMLSVIGEKNHRGYLRYLSQFLSNKASRMNRKDSLPELLKIITNKQEADRIFEFMAGDSDERLYDTFAAVKGHEIGKISDKLGKDGNVSIDEIAHIWKFYGEVKFEQFDIAMIALLNIRDNKSQRKKFINNYTFIIKSLRLLLLFVLYNSARALSPSQYSNGFERAAQEFWNLWHPVKQIAKDKEKDNNKCAVKTIREIFHDLFKSLDISKVQENEIKETIKGIKCSNSKRDRKLRLAKYIIQMVFDDYRTDLTAEHFIPESSSKLISFELGNIIPVAEDRYGDKTIDQKLEMYREDAEINPCLKHFLEFNISNENHESIIKKRTDFIAEKYWKIFESLRNECLK